MKCSRLLVIAASLEFLLCNGNVLYRFWITGWNNDILTAGLVRARTCDQLTLNLTLVAFCSDLRSVLLHNLELSVRPRDTCELRFLTFASNLNHVRVFHATLCKRIPGRRENNYLWSLSWLCAKVLNELLITFCAALGCASNRSWDHRWVTSQSSLVPKNQFK